MPERAALVDLYTSTNGDGWTHNTNWLSSVHPCGQFSMGWLGVVCESPIDSTLHTLILGSNGLAGTIPVSISKLTSLMYLHLWDNNLGGTVPDAFMSMTRL
jgi:hypothetical protein